MLTGISALLPPMSAGLAGNGSGATILNSTGKASVDTRGKHYRRMHTRMCGRHRDILTKSTAVGTVEGLR